MGDNGAGDRYPRPRVSRLLEMNVTRVRPVLLSRGPDDVARSADYYRCLGRVESTLHSFMTLGPKLTKVRHELYCT